MPRCRDVPEGETRNLRYPASKIANGGPPQIPLQWTPGKEPFRVSELGRAGAQEGVIRIRVHQEAVFNERTMRWVFRVVDGDLGVPPTFFPLPSRPDAF